MSKYKPLSEHFAARAGEAWPASFAELEQLLGFDLPKVARAGRAWWNDQHKSHSRAWTDHGWEVSEIDPAEQTVVFRRAPQVAAPPSQQQQHGAPQPPRAVVFAGLTLLAGIGALAIRALLRSPDSDR